MIGIALDFRGPRHVALDQYAGGHAAERHRGRVEKRLAGNDFLWLANVGNNFLRGKLGATRQAGKRGGGCHHFQEVSPVNFRIGIVGPVRKLIFLVVQEFRRFGKLIEPAPESRFFPAARGLAQCGNIHIGLPGVVTVEVHEFADPLFIAAGCPSRRTARTRYRWHVVQFVSFCTLYSAISRLPKAS